jgi:c(7)-type cytochrome triheme protein
MINRRLFFFGVCALTGIFLMTFLVDGHAFGEKKTRLKLNEYGNVVMNNFSAKEKMAPVVFKHWLHRSKYTCRLCHVDIGFAMEAGATGITEEDNKLGMYCGACHNGGEAFGPQETNSLLGMGPSCQRCHSYGKEVEFKYDFYTFRKQFSPERFGNGIDWLKAEEQGLLPLVDYLEGVSIRRAKIQEPKEFNLSAKEPNMPDILFSHKKHTVWNGCELCHPEIFGVKKDAVPYNMQEIFAGQYCGVCHGKVAFPNIDCQRCHTKTVS